MRKDSENAQNWFEALVLPLTRNEFFERYFEREALHVPRNVERPGLVLSDSERLCLMRGDPGLANRAEAVVSGRNIEVLKADPDTRISVHDVQAALEAGATVRLLGVHSNLPGVKLWADRLASEFGGTGSANVYITPANTPGVAAHYDTHDVLVHQISGSKHWSVYIPDPDYQPFLPLPSETGRVIDTSKLTKRSLTLRPGDLLYVPRGAAHATVAGNDHSIHITYGIQPVRWRDRMLDELLSLAEDDAFFRRAVRPDGASDFERHRNALMSRVMAGRGNSDAANND